jgi:hypothetical protein
MPAFVAIECRRLLRSNAGVCCDRMPAFRATECRRFERPNAGVSYNEKPASEQFGSRHNSRLRVKKKAKILLDMRY